MFSGVRSEEQWTCPYRTYVTMRGQIMQMSAIDGAWQIPYFAISFQEICMHKSAWP